MAPNPATYLLEGLFPNLFRYLFWKPRYTIKQLVGTAPAIVSARTQEAASPDSGFLEEQRIPEDGITNATIARDAPAKQPVTPLFISPHPLVTFAEESAIRGSQSNYVAASDVCDSERSLSLSENESPPPKSSEIDAESSFIKENLGTPAQTTSMSRQSPIVKAESSSAEPSFDASAQSSRPELSAPFDSVSQMRLSCRSLPSTLLSHSRNISTSSNETLVWCPNDPPFPPSPVMSLSDQGLQHAAEKVMGKQKADKVHELEEVIEELRLRLADQTERAGKLDTELELCERHRELNFNTALRLYRDPGNSILVERRNMIDQIHYLKLEVWYRDSQIHSRDQLIENLRLEVALYANHEQWVLMRQCYYALQQQYGQMPQDFRQLEQEYQDLENEYVDVSNKFKKLEGNHIEMKAQLEQIERERDRLQDAAKVLGLNATEIAKGFQKPGISGDGNDLPLTGNEGKSSAQPEQVSEPTLTGTFNFSSTSLAQTPESPHKPPQFKQDFNFGGSIGGVSFTATPNTSSSLPAPVPQPEWASESSVVGTSQAHQSTSSAAAQADEKVSQRASPTSHTGNISKEGTEEAALTPTPLNNDKLKDKKAKREARNREEVNTDGPNRKRRRAASRERRAAAKKAQAVADAASRRGRKAAAKKLKTAAGSAT